MNISFHVITEKSKTARSMKRNDKKEKRETRFLEEMGKTTNVTYLCGDKIATMGLIKKQPIGVLIQDASLYSSNKVIFDILWKIAKK